MDGKKEKRKKKREYRRQKEWENRNEEKEKDGLGYCRWMEKNGWLATKRKRRNIEKDRKSGNAYC